MHLLALSPGLPVPCMQAALDWLASLHAFHWEQALPEGLWHQGCYWHLDTRQEELQQIGAQRAGPPMVHMPCHLLAEPAMLVPQHCAAAC